ncbi:PREDICTED: CD2 antigen cytoplasmic tail-binding protein 2 homolog [Rhagoletis zephyria]|uniref:CD2 antigen cytoplasmic tail-binding protein 2 homolog n=1 Tax=Rhagoletis zephyria TaxID=28612 RepID=UPI000811976A|nr:PREDICTED: CD2 antigen cytoplasmic tail-binding protein 2 homolog [Rhagoletis zephyria]KAH9389852.1 CD2 antigen cytoplasmic tail-binding protein 2 [Tyrophagus putrescentiae]
MAEVNEEQPQAAEEEEVGEEVQLPFGKRFKRTLDSDEEDDELEDADKYRMDEFEGTEKSTIEFDGDIKITPFNMDEELETGHFDTEGTYIFKKEDDIRDNWLDNIDWGRVHKPEEEAPSTAKKGAEAETGGDQPRPSTEEMHKQIIELLRPGETIQRAIQRFGKDCPKVKKGSKQRKVETGGNKSSTDESKIAAAKESIMKLTSIADEFLRSGDMDIYERRFEEFQLNLNRSKATAATAAKEPAPSDDMFSDDFIPSTSKPTTSTAAKSADPQTSSSTVTWQFKWEDKEDAPIHGPFQSEAMQAWVDNGYFKEGVFVRRSDAEDARFYSSKRIDFDLYI